jgi:hypothetical protein
MQLVLKKLLCIFFADESRPPRSSRKKRGKTTEETMDTDAPASQSGADIGEEK